LFGAKREGNELGEIGILLTQRGNMQTEETRSWKEKIDPAFDELIKVCLDFIKNTCVCANDKNKRYLTLA